MKIALPRGGIGWLIFAVGLAPLGLAVATGPDLDNFWRELSAALALIGLSLLLIQFLLLGRFRVISGRTGIDVVLRCHQLLARVLFVFLLVHPLLYAMPRLISGRGGGGELLLGLFQSGRLRTGVIAWLLLMLLLAMAIWRDHLPIRYEAWRLTHGLGAAIVAALGLYHTLSVGGYSADPLLIGWWVLLGSGAFVSLAIVYFLRPLVKMRRPFRVIAVEPAALHIWLVVIEPVKGPSLHFAPSQFVWLNIGHSPFSLTEHPFSISSAPEALPQLEFTIKESGDFTGRIGKVRAGETAYLDGPHGNFVLPGNSATAAAAPIVFVAGGAGIAPVLSMLRSIAHRGGSHPVTLVYGNRVAEQIVARQELESMADNFGLQLHFVLGEPPAGWTGSTGQLTEAVLRECLGNCDAAALYYVCGPLPMMNSVEHSLRQFGVKRRQIITERFRYD